MQHLLGAESLELPVFQHAQDFHLGQGAHVGDFVEEQCALVGELELALDGLLRTRESAALVTEKLAFDQVSLMAEALKATNDRAARAEEL